MSGPIPKYRVDDKLWFKLPVHRQILGEPAIIAKIERIGLITWIDLKTKKNGPLHWTQSQVTRFCYFKKLAIYAGRIW